MDTVTFQNKEFKIREIELPEFGKVLISTTSLNESLFIKDGRYVSEEANGIDDQIYYFVEENEIELKEEKIISLLSMQIQ
jgi:hypothetical protein